MLVVVMSDELALSLGDRSGKLAIYYKNIRTVSVYCARHSAFLFVYVSILNHMGVLFCDTFINVTVSVRVALDSFISFI